MRLLSIVCIIVAITCCTSCRLNTLKGSGNKTTANPTVASFNAVDINIPLKLDITVQAGSQPGVQLSGYENVIKHIKTKVENNTLIITTDLDDTWTIDGDGITAQITLPAIIGLSLTGSPDADVHGNITGSTFDIDVSGASKITIDNINVDSFSMQVSGAGDLWVKGGAVKYAEYEISGAGDVKAFPLQSAETVASISGAGTGEVTALQKLTANISGAGTVKYKGHPSVTQDVSGAGAVKDAN